jgi:hypothetical protein
MSLTVLKKASVSAPAAPPVDPAGPAAKYALGVLLELAAHAPDAKSRIRAAAALLRSEIPADSQPPRFSQADVQALMQVFDNGLRAKVDERVQARLAEINAAALAAVPAAAAPAPHPGMWDGPGIPARGPFRGHS